MSESKKKCFVVMPMGSASQELKKKFDGVYRGIIVPAVLEAGYEPVREDISATPGSIPKSIVTKLAEAEMVIADLTSINPNVFYELGIRHTFAKCGTILMITRGETIPFDNASHRVIQYTNELADLDDVHKQIVSAIKKRESNADESDNIVHDTYPKLPINTIEFFSESVREERLYQLQKQVAELSKENARLKKICIDKGALDDPQSIQEQRSVKELMFSARVALEKSGQAVIFQLNKLVQDNNIDGFIDYLEGALDAGYMSEDDYISVNTLCGQLDFLPLQIAVMERAYDLFPDSEATIINLADIYTQMPLKETKMKGVMLMEKLLGIREVDGKYVIVEVSSQISESALTRLFNAYIRMGFHMRTITVCESYENLKLPVMSLVLRNKASAYDDLKMFPEAKKAYIELLDTDYYDDTNHAFYASFLHNSGDFEGEYREREIAAILDLNDASRLIELAISMLNTSYVRKDKNTIIRLRQSHEIHNYIMPLFIKAVEIDSSVEKRTRIAGILIRRKQSGLAQAIMESKPIDDTKFNHYPLEYILATDIEKEKSGD